MRAEVQIDLQSVLEKVKEQRSQAMDTVAQLEAAVDVLQDQLEVKDEEIARLNRLLDSEKSD